MNIGILQLNFTIGDFEKNAEKVARSYREAVDLGAEIVVAPELGLCGYPPRDCSIELIFWKGMIVGYGS